MKEPKDHKHVWAKALNFLVLVCQICQWRKSRIDGQILPPDASTTNAPIIEK